MGSHELSELSERFWRGECTEAEEKRLRMAVLYGEIAEDQQELADYFRFLERQQEVVLDEQFDAQILDRIQATKGESQGSYFLKMAAGFALLLGLGYGIYQWQASPVPPVEVADFTDTYDDPEVAYKEVKKALMMMSSNMNEGMEPAEKLGEFHRAQKELEEGH